MTPRAISGRIIMCMFGPGMAPVKKIHPPEHAVGAKRRRQGEEGFVELRILKPPTTSTTLLKSLGDTQSARWGDFVERYEPPMRAFLASRFPSVPADDMIQETLVALVRAMPSYVYSPKEHGHFRNYLLGILRHKALRHLRERRQETEAMRDLAALAEPMVSETEAEAAAFRDSVFELALAELLADPSIREQSKQIFIRVAINGEKPEAVATAFGVARNAVDQTKSRLIAKLRRIKDGLAKS